MSHSRLNNPRRDNFAFDRNNHIEDAVQAPGPWTISANFNADEYISRFTVPTVIDPLVHPNALGSAVDTVRTITFGRTDGNGNITPIPLMHCLSQTADIYGGSDFVFETTVLPPLSLNFEIDWPGYPIWQADLRNCFITEFGRGKRLTKSIFAYLIAKQYQTFIIHYGVHGYYHMKGMAPCPEVLPYMIGPGGLDMYRMNIGYIQLWQDGFWRSRAGLVVGY